MSKREQYGLVFEKIYSKEWGYDYYAKPKTEGSNSVLSFIGGLYDIETKSFIDDMQMCINMHGNVDNGFISDNVEHISIKYQYPNVNIDDILLIPMVDMKGVLEEWLAFIT